MACMFCPNRQMSVWSVYDFSLVLNCLMTSLMASEIEVWSSQSHQGSLDHLWPGVDIGLHQGMDLMVHSWFLVGECSVWCLWHAALYTLTDEVCDGILCSFWLSPVPLNKDRSNNSKQSRRSLSDSSDQHCTTLCTGSSRFCFCL